MTLPIVIKQPAMQSTSEGCGWCGTPYRNTSRGHCLYRFGVVTRRGIAWDDDNQFCSKWCFTDYHDDASFLDWVSNDD